ncbi:MAG: LysM peptidoglycan-binding domain-containing protein [Candidatus Cloacimonetes bacterium]|nr:LysM peptidoglycan-binding domain-containing protein [Candidatus Cloacimonadota bacterium]
MKTLLIFLLMVFLLFGCSYHRNITKKVIADHENTFPSNQVLTLEDSLRQIIGLKNIEIDSLYNFMEELNFTVDSLALELEIANSRIAVNTDFQIPDSIIFAGRVFDLSNERIFNKFETIYKQELKTAHKFIPRSGKYFVVFDSIFSQYDIPSDTKYLAIAESQLNSMAGSRVGAVGIWQFMPKTAKGYGMRINSFIDERRNVLLSTDAAIKYLLNAYQYLSDRGAKDWLLAMSSFNAGVGSIAKVIQQQEAYDFFDLLMRVDETHQYVWRAAAIKMIFENEEAIFGKKLERQQPLMDNAHSEQIILKGHYEIDNWAKFQGTSIGKVLELNPWINIYKRNREKYSAINNVVLPPGEYSILIPNGNNIDHEELVKIEKQFLKKNAGFFTHHIVKKGDTLYDIARKYKTTVARIKSLNNLRSNIIYPGQKLKLYGSSSSSDLSKSDKYYVVKKGETVGAIAAKLGVSQNRIISMNNLKNKNGIVIIHPGQKLYY